MELEAEDVYAALLEHGMSAAAAHLEHALEVARSRAFINPPTFSRADVEAHLDTLHEQGRILHGSDCGAGATWLPVDG